MSETANIAAMAEILTKPSGNVPMEIARMFGIRRLASAGRERIEAVIKNCEVTHENGADL